jgi:hypothetical protein
MTLIRDPSSLFHIRMLHRKAFPCDLFVTSCRLQHVERCTPIAHSDLCKMDVVIANALNFVHILDHLSPSSLYLSLF